MFSRHLTKEGAKASKPAPTTAVAKADSEVDENENPNVPKKKKVISNKNSVTKSTNNQGSSPSSDDESKAKGKGRIKKGAVVKTAPADDPSDDESEYICPKVTTPLRGAQQMNGYTVDALGRRRLPKQDKRHDHLHPEKCSYDSRGPGKCTHASCYLIKSHGHCGFMDPYRLLSDGSPHTCWRTDCTFADHLEWYKEQHPDCFKSHAELSPKADNNSDSKAKGKGDKKKGKEKSKGKGKGKGAKGDDSAAKPSAGKKQKTKPCTSLY
jgi:hypothetical protein